MNAPWFIDAHLDLSLNALEWNRDLTRPIGEIRAAEAGLTDKAGRGHGTVCFPEMRLGRVGLAVATQIGRVKCDDGFSPAAAWRSPAQAWAMTQGQLAWHRAMEEAGELASIRTRPELEAHAALWRDAPPGSTERLPIGCVRSLEGADSLITLAHLERAYADGLRAVGPAHYGPGIYARGTESTGGFPPRGRELLKEMERLGMILDVTHLSDDCFWEAIKSYSGPIWASHHNCRALVPHQRQLADEQIRALIERDAVIGVALDGWMLVAGWVRDQTTPHSCALRLEKVIEHIDHICQLAGDCLHIGLGSDLDGGFGREQTPCDLETIADVARLPQLLLGRGGTAEDAENFAHGNFLRFLWRALPR
ncbi:MAG: membrane dipeptidase [Verrucomicrobiota bacterium]|jgi:membrane dipeptidase